MCITVNNIFRIADQIKTLVPEAKVIWSRSNERARIGTGDAGFCGRVL